MPSLTDYVCEYCGNKHRVNFIFITTVSNMVYRRANKIINGTGELIKCNKCGNYNIVFRKTQEALKEKDREIKNMMNKILK